MADSKYGRLFTEADVEKLIRAAYEQGWDDRHGGGVGGYDHVMLSTLLVSEEGPWTFPADEPLFLLRGQDVYAPWAMQHYTDALAEGQMNGPVWPEGISGTAGELARLRERAERTEERLREAVAEQYDAAWQAWQAVLHWQREHPDRVKIPD